MSDVHRPRADRYSAAQQLFRQQRFAAAARELEPLLAANALPPEVTLLLARAYYRSGRLARAEALARALVARGGVTASGSTPDAAGDPDGVSGSTADTTTVYALLMLARTLQRRGRHVEAGTWLRRLDGLGYDTWGDDFSPVTSDEPITPSPPLRRHAA